jgi:NB-ARC domain
MTKESQVTKDMLQVMESIKHNNAHLHGEVQLIIHRNTLKTHQPLATPKTTLATLQSSEVQYPIIDIPYPRNIRSFCSRNNVFSLLDEALSRRPLQSDSASSPVLCVLHGMGGVGKTEIALEYAYKNRHNYECVFWVSAQSRVHLSQAYCAIGKQVGVISATHQHSRDQCEIEMAID